jgi:hypothetical protein
LPAIEAQKSLGRALQAWWKQGARSAFFREPVWSALRTTPATVALLIVVPYLFGILLERLYIPGAATFYWPALQVGWISTAVSLWVCWIAVPHIQNAEARTAAPGAIFLFSMLAAQLLTLQAVLALVFVPLARTGSLEPETLSRTSWWAAWSAPMTWVLLAQFKVVWQSSTRSRATKVALLLVLGGLAVFSQWVRPITFWYPVALRSPAAASAAYEFQLTQEVLEQQSKLLDAQLRELAPQRPGVVDVYAITYAPYAEEGVFRRESAMVAGVMETRFDAKGRTIQLVNHNETAGLLPWATPLNLQRTIHKMASLMDREEDILFIHLTSHGAKDGTLSTRLWPLSIEELKPAMLKEWLDAEHIRYRIISVSACYSGSWIEPLSSTGTLIVTAADADHTSYGCGKGSNLTYFGRAMFDEQLRRTWSFEDAHAAARASVEQRERDAGKSDGFSNPQIRIGDDVKAQLARLAREHARQSER